MAVMRGFTLIEMLVVLAIVGLIASLTMPDLTPVVRRTELRGAMGEMVGVLERARREARASGRCMRVRGETGGVVLERAGGARCVAPYGLVQRVRVRAEISLQLEATGGEITMTPSGRLLGNGDLNIEDDGARIALRSRAFPNLVSYVGVTAAGLVCSRIVSVLPSFSPATVCFQDPPFFGATQTAAGETELGDDDEVVPVAGVPGIVNEALLPGAPPPPPPALGDAPALVDEPEAALGEEAGADPVVEDAAPVERVFDIADGFSADGLLAQGSGSEA